VTRALRELGLWDNSIVVFSTDNGGQPWVGGNNSPLRGAKFTLYEGGSRAIGFAAFGKDTGLHPRSSRYDGLMHIADWYPTLLSLSARASGTAMPPPSSTAINGVDMSDALLNNLASPRSEVVLYLESSINMAAFRDTRYKLITGYPGDGAWTAVPSDNAPLSAGRYPWLDYITEWTFKATDYLFDRDYTHLFFELVRHQREHLSDYLQGTPRHPQLFDLQEDPREERNLASVRPEVLEAMMNRLAVLRTHTHNGSKFAWYDVVWPNPMPRAGVHPEFAQTLFHEPWLAEDVDVQQLDKFNVFDFVSLSFLKKLVGGVLVMLAVPSVVSVLIVRRRRSAACEAGPERLGNPRSE